MTSPPPPPPPPPPPKPLDRAKIPHHDIEEDVDIEHCSDSEESGSKSSTKEPKVEAKEEGGSGGGGSGTPAKKKKKKDEKPRIMKPKCNCEELLSVDCFLETKELWDKFNELGTEMIITKTGR